MQGEGANYQQEHHIDGDETSPTPPIVPPSPLHLSITSMTLSTILCCDCPGECSPFQWHSIKGMWAVELPVPISALTDLGDPCAHPAPTTANVYDMVLKTYGMQPCVIR